ncbi:asparagine synthase (glutamine-hydrolyzing) [endosymbiont of Riftia pachyptila]|uniref:asparagine synthase (glutamine-hydrolyzing) n=1 Tax=endosymbiont of Riftia pachyptila (vent Ph05) TaxID=1048808 RepID=G2DHH1_9GAMM|nr:asparagine synthase (glutamine-hydrolyzing) [endosymbiont of Riftia pachyptila]EGV49934.1 asparagine synthetase [endosymbiont of Riftia pachyptila (vent Ph05)]
MCGYAGIIWKNGKTPEEVSSFLTCMDTMLHHRGPDDGGSYVGKGFAVAHRRLSIIDIGHGHQPMLSNDGRVGIAYNGEIYNFIEIKNELEQQGHKFQTDCDTEVFLALFMQEGEASFEKLDGMFTAFIWDFRASSDGRFYLVRDHLGVKPLYLYEDEKRFVFSSELLPLLKIDGLDLSPDANGLASYLTYRYTQAPYTLFKNIRRVEAGNYIKIYQGRDSTWRFWDLPLNENSCELSADEAAVELKRLLRESVKQKQMSDVPVGLLLSGGLDSSAIASLCADIGVSLTSFNIGFPDLNEFSYSQAVSERFSLPHFAIETSPEEIAARFERVVTAMDEPIADPACFPLHILCDYIKEQVTVVLSGEGSDEMLGGYQQYKHVLGAPPSSQRKEFNHFLDFSWYFRQRAARVIQGVPPSRLCLQRIYFEERSLLSGMLAYDLKTWLPENLMAKADKILMSHSLEGRFPFLSPKIIEFVSGLPDDYKLDSNDGKIVLRRAFERDLPKEVLTRPKMGFSVPVGDLVLEMRDRLYDLLDSGRNGVFSNLLDCNAIREDFDDHFSGRNEQPLWLWTLFVILQWQDIAFAN